jgi:hypothetical protein
LLAAVFLQHRRLNTLLLLVAPVADMATLMAEMDVAAVALEVIALQVVLQ